MNEEPILLEKRKTYERYGIGRKEEATLEKIGREWALWLGSKQIGFTTTKKEALRKLGDLILIC